MIKTMDTLPDSTTTPVNNPAGTNQPASMASQTGGDSTVGGISSKEKELGGIPTGELTVTKELGSQEIELPKEVAAAGVRVKPTTVSLPAAVSQLGVKSLSGVSPAQTPAIALPLNDDQIAQGLKQGFTSSWRWLAEWCRRKLKQLHVGLKFVHGKLTRVTS